MYLRSCVYPLIGVQMDSPPTSLFSEELVSTQFLALVVVLRAVLYSVTNLVVLLRGYWIIVYLLIISLNH